MKSYVPETTMKVPVETETICETGNASCQIPETQIKEWLTITFSAKFS